MSRKHRIEKQTIKIAGWGEIFKPRFRILFKCSCCDREVEPDRLEIGRAHVYALHCRVMQDVGLVFLKKEKVSEPVDFRVLQDFFLKLLTVVVERAKLEHTALTSFLEKTKRASSMRELDGIIVEFVAYTDKLSALNARIASWLDEMKKRIKALMKRR